MKDQLSKRKRRFGRVDRRQSTATHRQLELFPDF